MRVGWITGAGVAGRVSGYWPVVFDASGSAAPDDAATPTAGDGPPVRVPLRLLVVNTNAGAGVVPDDAFDGFRRLGIGQLDAVLAEAPRDLDGVEVAVWGGDGTCRSVAQRLVGTHGLLLPCPGGTHNHFARAVGNVDLDAVQRALGDHLIAELDVGTVTDAGPHAGRPRRRAAPRAAGEVFLNNAVIGWYPSLVHRRQRLERVVPRRLAKVVSSIVQVLLVTRTRVTIDGHAETVWMLWVGNGRYSLEPSALAQREVIDDGLLDIRVLRADGRLPKLRAVLALLSGRIEASPAVERWTARECRVAVHGSRLDVALDGEVLRFGGSVQLRCEPHRLKVLALRDGATSAAPSSA